MLKVTTTYGTTYQASFGRPRLLEFDHDSDDIEKIVASGQELKLCCKLLEKNLPSTEFYVFSGKIAKEIANNWNYLKGGRI